MTLLQSNFQLSGNLSRAHDGTWSVTCRLSGITSPEEGEVLSQWLQQVLIRELELTNHSGQLH